MVLTRRQAAAAQVKVKNVQGFKIFRRAIVVHSEEVNKIANIAFTGSSIFNPDKLRFQQDLQHKNTVVARILSVLQEQELLEGRIVGPAVALHSFPGCLQQQFHTDYDAGSVNRAECKPLGILAALQDNTFFILQDQQLALQKGDLLAFDGDLVHAGAAYEENNTRIHVYLDVPSVHREHNTTYFPED